MLCFLPWAKETPFPSILLSNWFGQPSVWLACSLLFWPNSAHQMGWGISRKKWSHCYVCEKRHGLDFRNLALILTLPFMRPWECLFISLGLSFLIYKIECGGHKKCTSQIFHFMECNWPRAPCCLKSITILAPPAKVWVCQSCFWEKQVHFWETWDYSDHWLWPFSFVKTFFELKINQRLFCYPKFLPLSSMGVTPASWPNDSPIQHCSFTISPQGQCP